MAKNLYLLWQVVNNDYDTYDSAVVCAESEQKAKEIDPSGHRVAKDGKWYFQYANGQEAEDDHSSWAAIENVKVRKIGKAEKDIELGLVLASFNAG